MPDLTIDHYRSMVRLALDELERKEAQIRVLQSKVDRVDGWNTDLQPAYESLVQKYGEALERVKRAEAAHNNAQAIATALQDEIDLIAEEVGADSPAQIRNRIQEIIGLFRAQERALGNQVKRAATAENVVASLKLERESIAALLGADSPAHVLDQIRALKAEVEKAYQHA